MIIVIAVAEALPEHAEAMVPLLAKASQESRKDDGCIDYHFYRDIENPNRFVSVEQWESKAHLDAHMGGDNVQALLGALPGKVAAEPVITVHDVSASTPYS
ncbi:MAG: putative quinol monooxygenase [Mycobacteriaceae bacterium]